MYNFNYHKPASVAEAQTLLADAEDGLYLAGGHTLLPTMKQRLRAPTDVIDLSAIEGLRGIEDSAEALTIGAMTCHDAVATSAQVGKAIPALAHLAAGIGDAQVRNRGTIGGSVANSDPAADYPAAIVGLGATIETDSREISADDFFTGMFETALQAGEMIQRISFPIPETAGYLKFPNPASRYATVGVMISRSADAVRVAITGAAPCVFRSTAMEQALAANFSAEALAGISLSPDDMNSDIHASAEYRAHLCSVMARRVMQNLT